MIALLGAPVILQKTSSHNAECVERRGPGTVPSTRDVDASSGDRSHYNTLERVRTWKGKEKGGDHLPFRNNPEVRRAVACEKDRRKYFLILKKKEDGGIKKGNPRLKPDPG